MTNLAVPFFRPDLSGGEIDEVVATLKSGWLTTGPRTKRFEEEFAAAVGARHALAVNSCHRGAPPRRRGARAAARVRRSSCPR